MKHIRIICTLLTASLLFAGTAVLSSCDNGNNEKQTEAPGVLTGEDLTDSVTEADTADDEPAKKDDTSSAVVWRTVAAPDYTQYLNPANISRALTGTDAIVIALNGQKAWVDGAYKDGVSGVLARENGELKVSGSVLSDLSGKSVQDGDVYAAARAMGMNAEVFDKKLVLFYSGDKTPLSSFEDCYTMEALWLELTNASEEDRVNALITLPSLISNGESFASYYTDPNISLAVQTNVYYAALGDNDAAATGPALVVGEGKQADNHTLVRVLNRQQITTSQFLAFAPDVKGGVQVAAARTEKGEVLIACAAYDPAQRDIRVFDENGNKRMVLTPDERLAAPYTILTGHFLSGVDGDVLLICGMNESGELVIALYSLASGEQLSLFRLNCAFAAGSDVRLSRRTVNGAADKLIIFFPGVSEAYEGDCETRVFNWTGIQIPENATGVFASVNEGETYVVTVAEDKNKADQSFVRVYNEAEPDWGILTDVGFKENVFYASLASDNDYGYVDHLDFQHIRADLTNSARANLNSQSTVQSFDDLLLKMTYKDYNYSGVEGYMKSYFTGNVLLEPCFTHRWNGGTMNNFVGYTDDEGNHIFAACGRSGNYESYIELDSAFDNGTYADGLVVLAKLRTFPIRSFTRAMAGVYRGPDGDPTMLIGMSPVHEQEINVDGSVGDYNIFMVRGFASHLLSVYGSVQNINERFGTSFADESDIDAPRNAGRGAWDAYSGDYFMQWSLYTRNMINKRIMESYREALLAGFPPETITSHQIPEGDAVSGFLGQADTRLSPCDAVMSSGTGFGATRYGTFYNDKSNFVSIANASGHNSIELGEYCALTENASGAYKQLEYLWKTGVRAIHYITFNDNQTAAEREAVSKLQTKNEPRPGYTGGTTSLLNVMHAGRTYAVVQIGAGDDKEGLLKSVTKDGSFEGTVYVVPFHAHVNVTALAMEQAGLTYTSEAIKGLQNGDQVELTFDAAYTGAGKASVTITVSEAGIVQEGSCVTFEIEKEQTAFRYVLSNQISPEDMAVSVTFSADDESALTVSDMVCVLETECVGRKYFVGGKQAYKDSEPHKGGVTFDVLTRDMLA